jgi:hypothetical protein
VVHLRLSVARLLEHFAGLRLGVHVIQQEDRIVRQQQSLLNQIIRLPDRRSVITSAFGYRSSMDSRGSPFAIRSALVFANGT